jgi:hypothetical protein
MLRYKKIGKMGVSFDPVMRKTGENQWPER